MRGCARITARQVWESAGLLAVLTLTLLTPALARCDFVDDLARWLLGLNEARPSAASALPRSSTPAQVTVVSQVLIFGNQNIPTERIQALLKTRPGAEYKPALVQEDVRTLSGTRLFASLDADVQNEGPNRVKVLFHVRECPIRKGQRTVTKEESSKAFPAPARDLTKPKEQEQLFNFWIGFFR